jgi:hypothetical protein
MTSNRGAPRPPRRAVAGGASLKEERMRVLVKDLPAHVGQEVELMGFLHWRRDLGKVQFLLLRDRSGVVQVVTGGMRLPLPESSLRVRGLVVENLKAPGGLEVQAKEVEVLSPALEPAPVEIPKEEWRAHPDTLLEYRYVTLRGRRPGPPSRCRPPWCGASAAIWTGRTSPRSSPPRWCGPGRRGGLASSGWTTLRSGPTWPSPLSFTSRSWWGSLNGSTRWPPCGAWRSTTPAAT